MEISWLGHSCFKLRDKQATLITDPYPPDLGYSLGKQIADIVTLSHQHPGHSFAQGINGNPKIVTGPGEYEISNMLIIGVSTFHDNEKGIKRGKNTVYLIEMNEVSICHLGDLGHILSHKQITDIGLVDILLIPVGGYFTIDHKQATVISQSLKPRVIIPMHYKNSKCNYPISKVDEFLRGKNNVRRLDLNEVDYKKSELPEAVEIVVLQPAL